MLINATSAGTGAAGQNPIAGTDLDGEMVFDLVYSPAETKLLADARAAGCLTIGGLEMLVAQAERQFELWTGQRPPVGLFDRAAKAAGKAAEAATTGMRTARSDEANYFRRVRRAVPARDVRARS